MKDSEKSNPSKKAVVVIDMLNDFILEGAPLEVSKGRDIVPNIEKLVNKAHERNIQIIYLCDNHMPNDPEFESWPGHCVKETEGAKIIGELTPKEGDIVIPKRRYSGFFGTDLDLHLRENGIDTVFLTGVCTDICVYFTSVDAFQRGYKVNVVEDATATLTDEAHNFSIKQVKNLQMGTVLTTEEALDLL